MNCLMMWFFSEWKLIIVNWLLGLSCVIVVFRLVLRLVSLWLMWMWMVWKLCVVGWILFLLCGIIEVISLVSLVVWVNGCLLWCVMIVWVMWWF